jgi:hypothetical protein
MILVKTNYSCLRVGCHSWYQSIMGVIHHVRPYFQKHTVRKYLDAHIRTIVVLTCGKLTGFYFLHLLYASYYSIMMHLRQGKKVSIVPPGNVNPGLIPLRRGLLGDCPYRAVGTVCLLCDWPRSRT